LTRATYLNIVEESFMTMVFPGGSGLFQQDNDPGLQIPQVSSEPQQVWYIIGLVLFWQHVEFKFKLILFI